MLKKVLIGVAAVVVVFVVVVATRPSTFHVERSIERLDSAGGGVRAGERLSRWAATGPRGKRWIPA